MKPSIEVNLIDSKGSMLLESLHSSLCLDEAPFLIWRQPQQSRAANNSLSLYLSCINTNCLLSIIPLPFIVHPSICPSKAPSVADEPLGKLAGSEIK